MSEMRTDLRRPRLQGRLTSADASSWALTLAEVTENLRKRADKRPVKLASLKNAIKTSFPKAGALHVERALEQLQAERYVEVKGSAVWDPKVNADV